MSTPDDDSLMQALETLRAARARVLEGPACPKPLLRRVQGLWDVRPMAGLMRLVFDSWADLAPAARGPGRPRSLRFEAGPDGMDLRVVRRPDGTGHVQIAVDPPREGLVATVKAVGARRGRQVELSSDGVGQAPLGVSRDAVFVVVRDGEEEILRSPPVELE